MALESDIDPFCVNCWSGPRCCSTSLMYSFAQRSDTEVLDEPLYASYLKLTGMPRPYLDLVLSAQDSDGNRVVSEKILSPRNSKVLYAKHIGKQKIGIDLQIYGKAQHMILVREPYGVAMSFSDVLEPTLQELGYGALVEIYSQMRTYGRPPVVVVSDDLVREPEAMLRTLCLLLGLPFEESMLTWPAGPKPYDGVWAPWWYKHAHKSTGFRTDLLTPRSHVSELPQRLRPLLAECWPLWDFLRQHAMKPLDTSVPAGLSVPGVAAGEKGEKAVEKSEKSGTHVYKQDARNADVLVGMRDGVRGTFEMVWRGQAHVSVLDSAFMLGDGVWEGMRAHRGGLLFARQHLDRLFEAAHALDMDLGLDPPALARMMYDTLMANGMAHASGVHIRLMVSRGLKPTPYQNPATTIGSPTIVILPEYKEAATGPRERGIRLFTSHVRRGAADVQDPMWNSHSKLNCIAACIQANKAGADEALMLDPHGFVATCNSTNFLVVRRGAVWAPTTRYQLHGITRQNVLDLCHRNAIPARELDFTLTEVYGADEAFVTGTFAGLIPVVSVDGRMIGDGTRGPITSRLQALYSQLVEEDAARALASRPSIPPAWTDLPVKTEEQREKE